MMKIFKNSTSFKTIIIEFFSIALGNKVNNDDMAEGFKDTFLILNELESQLMTSYKTTLNILQSRAK